MTSNEPASFDSARQCRVVLRRDEWADLRERLAAVTDQALAERLGVDTETVRETFASGVASWEFVAHTMYLTDRCDDGAGFADLFGMVAPPRSQGMI